MLHLVQSRQRFAAHALGWRSRTLKVRELTLEILELREELIVLEIRNLGVGEDIVAAVVVS